MSIKTSDKGFSVQVSWSGAWPNLCSGKWTCKINGKQVKVPFQGEPAGCEGTYQSWHFSEDWDEVWENYRDGLDCSEWCEQWKDWLDEIGLSEEERREVYEAFAEEDWRYGSCGGCI
jgi:hypothetical protein|nr:MAG TPA: toxin [Caudoviricetes sp.]